MTSEFVTRLMELELQTERAAKLTDQGRYKSAMASWSRVALLRSRFSAAWTNLFWMPCGSLLQSCRGWACTTMDSWFFESSRNGSSMPGSGIPTGLMRSTAR